MKQRSVLHVSTECYPVAKAGGMADVVGSLPVYQVTPEWAPAVIIPKYNLPWFDNNPLRKIHGGSFTMEGKTVIYEVLKAKNGSLPFDFYCIDIPGYFDRTSIYLDVDGYGFKDEPERNISFQRALLDWLVSSKKAFDIIHCHDHQVGFIPFLMKKVKAYASLSHIPTFYTIHNGAYNSRYPWDRRDLLPRFESSLSQYLDWDGNIDAVAAAMRFANHVNAVSPNYLEELKASMVPLQFMSGHEPDKFSGILNGIDDKVWDPKTDELLESKMGKSWDRFKKLNKKDLLHGLYHLEGIPLIGFIGRFAHQKGADLLVPAIEKILARFGFVNFYILGSGDPYIEQRVQELRDKYSERVGVYIGYNEKIAHRVYAASDFLVMPSRFEPCGLNQMFAMRYGSLPIARMTGGLKDTVLDYESEGTGIAFTYDSVEDLTHALARALNLYKDTKAFRKVRSRAVKQDYSWTKSAQQYIDIYNNLITTT